MQVQIQSWNLANKMPPAYQLKTTYYLDGY